MARRNNNKMTRRSSKLEPVPLTLSFVLGNPVNLPGSPTIDRYYIDISQCASLVSRKFLRQGLNWGFAGLKVFDFTPGTVQVSKLPNTWVMSNAWHKSFAAWNRMNNEALSESESVRPRFLDFKVYANEAHHIGGFPNNQLPRSELSGLATAGEWEPSKMVIPIGTASPGASGDREFVAVGPNYPGFGASGLDAVSLIEGYAASRGLPNVLDPNAPDDASDVEGFNPQNWIAATFNQGTDQTQDVVEDMISENNIAPYPFENDGVNVDTMYPGGANQLVGLEVHDIVTISATTVGGMARVKGGNAPCGLLEIACSATDPLEGMSPTILLELIPGPMRGYLAEPMQDM